MDNLKLKIVRVTATGREEREDTVVREGSLTIYLNNRELVTVLCSPAELDALAVGFLFSEGLLRGRQDIKDVEVDAAKGMVRVATVDSIELDGGRFPRRAVASSGSRGAAVLSAADVEGLAEVESVMTVKAGEVLALVEGFQHRSPTFLKTRGVHSAALCDNQKILVFAEDIGRHNAIDKVFGRCMLDGLPTSDRIAITSGRVSSEILLKVARRQVPIIVSVAAPTDVGVALADELGMTLVGFVREQRMNVYTHDWRIR
jgi:FdhD protein